MNIGSVRANDSISTDLNVYPDGREFIRLELVIGDGLLGEVLETGRRLARATVWYESCNTETASIAFEKAKLDFYYSLKAIEEAVK